MGTQGRGRRAVPPQPPDPAPSGTCTPAGRSEEQPLPEVGAGLRGRAPGRSGNRGDAGVRGRQQRMTPTRSRVCMLLVWDLALPRALMSPVPPAAWEPTCPVCAQKPNVAQCEGAAAPRARGLCLLVYC